MAMSVRERWSVRELRRPIHASLFERYTSVKSEPEKCLPSATESRVLTPFKDHYILEFLGLEDEHTDKELRKAILANMRDFFLEIVTFLLCCIGRTTPYVAREPLARSRAM